MQHFFNQQSVDTPAHFQDITFSCWGKIGDSLLAFRLGYLCLFSSCTIIYFQLGRARQIFLHLFRPNDEDLTYRKLVHLLTPKFADDGENKRIFQDEVYELFMKYAREVAGELFLFLFFQ